MVSKIIQSASALLIIVSFFLPCKEYLPEEKTLQNYSLSIFDYCPYPYRIKPHGVYMNTFNHYEFVPHQQIWELWIFPVIAFLSMIVLWIIKHFIRKINIILSCIGAITFVLLYIAIDVESFFDNKAGHFSIGFYLIGLAILGLFIGSILYDNKVKSDKNSR